MNNHPDSDRLFLYSNNLLLVSEHAEVFNHLSNCSQCKSIVAKLQGDSELLAKAFSISPVNKERKSEIFKTVYQKNQAYSKQLRILFITTSVAAVLLISLLVVILGGRNEGIQYENALVIRSGKAIRWDGKLLFGDTVQVIEDPMVFSFKDGSLLTVSPDSQFQVNRENSERGYSINVSSGEFFFDVAKNRSKLVVHTQAGLVYVLGTKFSINIFNGGKDMKATTLVGISGAAVVAVAVIVGTVKLVNDSGQKDVSADQVGVLDRHRPPSVADKKDVDKLANGISAEKFASLLDEMGRLKNENEQLKLENVKLNAEKDKPKPKDESDPDLKRYEKTKLMDDKLMQQMGLTVEQEKKMRLAMVNFFKKRDVLWAKGLPWEELQTEVDKLKEELDVEFQKILDQNQYSQLKEHRVKKIESQKEKAIKSAAKSLGSMLGVKLNDYQAKQIEDIVRIYYLRSPFKGANDGGKWMFDELVQNQITAVLNADQSDKFKEWVKYIKKASEKQPYLGITPDDSSDSKGAVVKRVAKDSPSEKAGIVVGDIITELAGKSITSSFDLFDVLEDLKIGDTVNVKIVRNNAETVFQVIVGSR